MILHDDLSQVILAELSSGLGWQQQYKVIIQWGRLIQPKLAIRVPENRIKGCEVPVWLAHEQKDEQHYFAFDSDSRVMNGLAVLLLVQLNGKSAAQIARLDLPATLAALGFDKHLTPSRSNGFKRIMERALVLATD